GFRIREHAQIHACGKVLSSRGDHNHPGIGIGFNVLNAARQLQPESLVHGIQRFRATELNMGDVVFYFNIETFVVGEFRHDGSRIICEHGFVLLGSTLPRNEARWNSLYLAHRPEHQPGHATSPAWPFACRGPNPGIWWTAVKAPSIS